MKYMHTNRLRDYFGWDSIQGCLEWAENYSDAHIRFGFNKKNIDVPGSTYFNLMQLDKEGYLHARFENDGSHDPSTLFLVDLSLTTEGHKLLKELRDSSRLGRIKGFLSNLLGVALTSIVTTIITTLVVIEIKGL